MVVGLGFFVIWLVLVVKALQGERFKLPVIGDFAEQQALTQTHAGMRQVIDCFTSCFLVFCRDVARTRSRGHRLRNGEVFNGVLQYVWRTDCRWCDGMRSVQRTGTGGSYSPARLQDSPIMWPECWPM